MLGEFKRLVESWGYNRVLPRESYIHKDMHIKEVKIDDLGLVFHVSEKPDAKGRWYAIAFKGRANKPLWSYAFCSEDDMEERIGKEIEFAKVQKVEIDKRKKERSEYVHDYKVGDILVASWGYDQTQNDWFQVVGLKDKAIVIREIAGKSVDDSHAVAVPDHFVGAPMVKRVSSGGYVKIHSSASAHKWDGQPKYETPFGMGH